MLFFVLLPLFCDNVFFKKRATLRVPLPFGSVFFPCRVPQPISVVFVFRGVQKNFPCGACGTVHSRALDSCVLSVHQQQQPVGPMHRVKPGARAQRSRTLDNSAPWIAQTRGGATRQRVRVVQT